MLASSWFSEEKFWLGLGNLVLRADISEGSQALPKRLVAERASARREGWRGLSKAA